MFSHLIRSTLPRIPLWLKRAVLGALATLLLLLVWGVAIEPRLFEVREETVYLPGLPPAWEGRQVALIADPQVGMFLGNTDTVRRIVAHLVERRPAAVLIAGDFIYHPLEDEPEEGREELERNGFRQEAMGEIQRVTAMLRPLPTAGVPTYAVLGNHDYGIKERGARPLPWLAARVQSTLEEIGIRVLLNEAVPMTTPTQHESLQGISDSLVYLVGLDSHQAGKDQAAAALSGVPPGAPRLVLMHNPASFSKLAAGSAPVALAGHSHGGQIRIPFLPHWSIWDIIRQKEQHMDGWIRDYGSPGNRLYVNRGIGFSVVPVRINCRPEITMITLRAVP